MRSAENLRKRRVVIITIMGLIAVFHLLDVEPFLSPGLFSLYAGYFSDIVLPFGCYFLLCMTEKDLAILKHWWVKSMMVFLLPAAVEICQYFGIPVLGATYDPRDFIMYAAGAITAALIEKLFFFRIFSFWKDG